ncbi:MAG TPA: polysaccharide biosynthesis tyrosine autokinase [Thermoanaerobaculia bacterium]|nr:polysaccharide biosynthesis tyrosine autokinase [Thermoanaerobaculia bacterium]
MSSQWEPPDDTLPAEDAPAEFQFATYWAIVVKRRRLIALCIAIGLLGAAVASILAKPSYKASAILSVEKDRGSPIDIKSMDQSASGYDPEYLPTQMRLMRSRQIAERVVRRLNLVAVPDAGEKKSGFFRKPGDTAVTANAAVTSKALKVQGMTDASQVRGTNLVEITCIADTPVLAANIANALADSYIDWNVEARFRSVDETSQFLSAQIQQLRADLDGREKQLLAYGRQKDIVASEPNANSTMQNLQTLNTDFATAVAERVAKEARYNEIRNAPPEAVVDMISSSSIGQLRNEQARLEREYAEKLNLYKPEWPAMQQLKIQIDKGRQHLDAMIRETVNQARETARSDYQTAMRREASMKGVLGAQKSEAMNVNSNAVEYNNLRVEIETKKALLDNLLKRKGETDVMSGLRGDAVSNIRLVDRALPPVSRFSPSYVKNGLIGLLAGVFSGIGLSFLLSFLDRSLRTADDVERYLQVPALGVIPSVGGSEARALGYSYKRGLSRGKKLEPAAEDVLVELLPHRQPRSLIAERYRAFRTSLLMSRAGGLKSILITSAFSREGKTVTAVNLAVVLAQLGKRVLLVDADLHRPRLHEIFHVSNRIGLVSILAESLSPERAIIPTDIPDLFLVTAGPNTPNPSGLLSSEGMGAFLDLAGFNYDYLILDGPPVLPVADSLVVGHKTDGAVVCIRGGETPREDVARACAKLRRSGVRILGALLNNVTEESHAYGKNYNYDDGYYAGDPVRPEKVGSAALAATRLRPESVQK